MIDFGKTKSLQDILQIVNIKKEEFSIKETKEYILKINEFASQFGDINNLQGLLNSANEQINILQELLKSIKDQLIVNTEEISVKDKEILSFEKQLEISNEDRSIFLKIYRKIKKI